MSHIRSSRTGPSINRSTIPFLILGIVALILSLMGGGLEAVGLALILAVVAIFVKGQGRIVLLLTISLLIGVFAISAFTPRGTAPLNSEPVITEVFNSQ